jgi:hypothetical protein
VTYQDELTAALARAEAAERTLRERTEVKPVRKTKGTVTRWLRENIGRIVFTSGLVGAVSFLVWGTVTSSAHAKDIRSCYVRSHECEYGRVLCDGK